MKQSFNGNDATRFLLPLYLIEGVKFFTVQDVFKFHNDLESFDDLYHRIESLEHRYADWRYCKGGIPQEKSSLFNPLNK